MRTRVDLPGMVERGAGHLALVSSTAGVLGVPGYTAYAATRTFLRFGGALQRVVRWSLTRTVKRARGTG